MCVREHEQLHHLQFCVSVALVQPGFVAKAYPIREGEGEGEGRRDCIALAHHEGCTYLDPVCVGLAKQ